MQTAVFIYGNRRKIYGKIFSYDSLGIHLQFAKCLSGAMKIDEIRDIGLF